jgi:hypothetical protein
MWAADGGAEKQRSDAVGPKPRAAVTSLGMRGSAYSGTRAEGSCNQSGQRIISGTVWDPSSGPLSSVSIRSTYGIQTVDRRS